MDEGGVDRTKFNQTPNIMKSELTSETMREKFHGQKGNSPDLQLRSQSYAKCNKDVMTPGQPGGWLRSSHPLKSA